MDNFECELAEKARALPFGKPSYIAENVRNNVVGLNTQIRRKVIAVRSALSVFIQSKALPKIKCIEETHHQEGDLPIVK